MKRLRTPKTAKVLREHVRRRALERFNIDITRAEIDQIVKQIAKNEAMFVDRQSLTVTRWRVKVRDMEVAVVYDKVRGTIRTVMPVEYLYTSPKQKEIERIIKESE